MGLPAPVALDWVAGCHGDDDDDDGDCFCSGVTSSSLAVTVGFGLSLRHPIPCRNI